MSIHAITGVMGSGKSYEAVSEKIVPALRDDDTRRVVTNIDGLNIEEIAKFIDKSVESLRPRLVHVTYERVIDPNFWYDPEAGVFNSVVQPGDLVVLDEVWRYFNRGLNLPDDAMRFFRMHRHYAAENGHTCDVVLINQAMRGIHSDIRDIIEVQFNCRKLKVLGRPQNYQVFVIEGGERKHSHMYVRKYSDKVFPLYKSHDKQGAKESLDKRQSALGKPFFKIVLPLALVGIVGGSYIVYNSFANMGKTDKVEQPTPPLPSTGSPVSPAPAPATTGSAGGSSDWRVVAMYHSNNLPVFVLLDSAGRYRTVTGAKFSSGVSSDLTVSLPDSLDSAKATPWTGSSSNYTNRTTK